MEYIKLAEYFFNIFPNLFVDEGILKLAFDSTKLQDNITIHLRAFQIQRNRENKVHTNTNKIDTFPPFLENFYETEQDYEKRGPGQIIIMSEPRLIFEIEVETSKPNQKQR